MASFEQTGDDVRISGRLDVEGASELFDSPPEFSTSAVNVDISAVEEFDSAGLSLLVYWQQQAASHNCVLTVHGAGEQATNLIRISALDSVLLREAR